MTTRRGQPLLTYEEELELIKAEKAKPRRSCHLIREDLKNCIFDSACVKQGKSPKECLLEKNNPDVPDRCYQLRTAFFECKRSLIDMRTRFRGRKGY